MDIECESWGESDESLRKTFEYLWLKSDAPQS